MYNRLFVDVCGMFNGLHFLSIGLFFAILAILLVFSRRMTQRGCEAVLSWGAVALTILEVVKIVLRIRKGLGPDSWMPLYYCSLFLFAIWLTRLPGKTMPRIGYTYMTMGGIMASTFFIFYPSTSLGMYPILSSASLHSFFYHLVMCYCGILVLWKGEFCPRRKDSIGYFCFILAACILGYFSNRYLGTNCMFLTHPFELPVLQPILEASKVLYMAIVCLAQASAMFWVNFGLYCWLFRRRRRNYEDTISG